MPSTGGLIFHLTRLVHVPYIGKLGIGLLLQHSVVEFKN